MNEVQFLTKYYELFQQYIRSVIRLLVVPSSPILVTLMMEKISCSETSVLT
jgi:hypothetical protein